MSRGKYSPWCYNNSETIYNCYGEFPIDEWDRENYNEKLMFANYDSEGFDSYGYSAFELDGTYAGIGSGVDRYGYTENQYMSMTDEYFQNICAYADPLHNFKRNRDTEVKLTENHDIIQTSQTKGNVMKLGEVKAAFDALENNGFVFTDGFITPHAYRGDYHQVAFQPTKNISLAEIKCHLHSALNDSFVGYFSGHYTYDENTQVNLSRICAYDDTDGKNFEMLVTIMLNEYHDADHTSAQKKVRKTKAQKQAEAAIACRDEQQKEWEEFCSGTGWDQIGVVLTPIPPKEYSWKYAQSFRDAEQAIETEREKQREVERKELLKQTALAKLSDEERKVLGL